MNMGNGEIFWVGGSVWALFMGRWGRWGWVKAYFWWVGGVDGWRYIFELVGVSRVGHLF